MNSNSPFKPDCLSGKVALVTGGGSGICFEIARQLLLHGCKGIVICGRREPFLRKASKSLQNQCGRRNSCAYKRCDVRMEDQCRNAVEYCIEMYGRLDILVNGAAGNFLADAGSSLKPKGFQTVMEIDAMGTFNMCHVAYPYLKSNGKSGVGGAIINISATLQYGATWYQAHASAAKSAVDSLTRSLALEWGQDGIRVNGIAPGPIADTPGMTKLAPGLSKDNFNELVGGGIPLGRPGRAFEIGMAAVYLCADGSGGWVTGDVLVVDGGEWLWKPPLLERNDVKEISRGVERKSRSQEPSSLKLTSRL